MPRATSLSWRLYDVQLTTYAILLRSSVLRLSLQQQRRGHSYDPLARALRLSRLRCGPSSPWSYRGGHDVRLQGAAIILPGPIYLLNVGLLS